MKTYTSFINEIKEANVPAKVMKAIYNALGAATSDGRSTGAIAMNSSLNNKTPKNIARAIMAELGVSDAKIRKNNLGGTNVDIKIGSDKLTIMGPTTASGKEFNIRWYGKDPRAPTSVTPRMIKAAK